MAGEGSRGGHIVRHTKSGKPVYGAPREKSERMDTLKKYGKVALGVGAGIGLGVAAGYASGFALRSAAKFGNRAKMAEMTLRQPDLFKSFANTEKEAKEFVIRNKNLENLLNRVETGIRHGGNAAGAALVGSSAMSGLKGTKYDTTENRAKIGAVSGAGAFLALETGHLKNVMPHGTKLGTAFKTAAQGYLRKLATSSAVKGSG